MSFLKTISTITLLFLSLFSFSQEKTSLTFEDYNTWKNLGRYGISSEGTHILYQIKPLTFGDQDLVIYQPENNTSDTLTRTQLLALDGENRYFIAKVHVPYDTIKSLTLKKVPKKKHPVDTLLVQPYNQDTSYYFTHYKSFKKGEENSSWMAIGLSKYTPQEENPAPEEPSLFQKIFKKQKEVKSVPTPKASKTTFHLVSLQPETGETVYHGVVSDYIFSDYNNQLGFITTVGKDKDSTGVFVYNYSSQSTDTLFYQAGNAKSITSDEKGEKWSFLASADTTDTKVYSLYLYANNASNIVADTLTEGMPENWSPSEYKSLSFSKDGTRLFFGANTVPTEDEEDSLLTAEKPRLDVWNYQDLDLQPRQLLQKKRDEKKTYRFVYHINNQQLVQIENDSLELSQLPLNGNARYALVSNPNPFRVEYSWSYPWKRDWYRLDITNGDLNLLLAAHGHNRTLTPNGDYFIWYDANKNDWFSKNLSTDSVINLTQELRAQGAVLTNPENDVPAKSFAYGIDGFTKNGKAILTTRFSIYSIDYSGNEPAQLLTQAIQEPNTHYSLLNFSPDENYINLDTTLLFSSFNYATNQMALLAVNGKKNTTLLKDDASFYSFRKAENANRFIFKQSTYVQYPDLRTFDLGTELIENTSTHQVSDFQKQRDAKLWGTNEKYYWTNEQGNQKGLLFYPENFDSTKVYPLMVYFYEKDFNTQHNPRMFRPSPSTISIPFYNSNGYIVFVPDINYTTGQPGQDAYNAIVSGAESLAQLPFIDGEKMAIQGQSWGGYQVAYLVTQTDLFAAGMAGAPVSNMISAYGGIRWGSGLSRQFQYEQTQSRIGGDLWNSWNNYRDNSPIYHAPNTNTPLLIMHNDNDGAVPWYQGIELFVGLRRLNKPVWMLNYNGDQHNLMKTANRIDLSKRMYGFFNHYLKGEPMPFWMKEGIPAVDKGKVYGYD